MDYQGILYLIRYIFQKYRMKKIRLRLDILLQEAGINRLTLSKQTGISYPVIDRYYKNTVRQYDSSVLLRICLALGCDIKDLLEIVDE